MREDVIIKTATGDLRGHLFVGHDHLPELAADERDVVGAYAFYRPATVPATWTLLPVEGPGILLLCWREISLWQGDIALAQREAEECDQQEDIEAGASNQAREREIDNRVASEIDNQREEEAEDICGFCGLVGADKIPHPVRWPDEESAGTELVHANCENEECVRASAMITGQRRIDFLRSI